MYDPVIQFYDQLASDYHLIFADWQQAVLRQSQTLDALIRAEMSPPVQSVLDCSCGIGTQAIGLALRGYRVHATDLSPAAVERARREAASFGVEITFGVADLRSLQNEVAGTFDVVISCDNALPHLLQDTDLQEAARSMWSKLVAGGLLLVSIRDYDQLLRERPRTTQPHVFDDPEGRRIVFQVWDWADDGRIYTVHQFIVREAGGAWATAHYATKYRALQRHELGDVLHAAGFGELRWHMPEESGYYQPIVAACKS